MDLVSSVGTEHMGLEGGIIPCGPGEQEVGIV